LDVHRFAGRRSGDRLALGMEPLTGAGGLCA
jgi:hypothetical protein